MALQMAFFRLVEVFPPMFQRGTKEEVDIRELLADLVYDVKKVRKYIDLVLVSNVKNPQMVKLSSIEVAAELEEKAKVRAAPVIVARDMNRQQMVTTLATTYTLGLETVMLAWGDRYTEGSPRNAYDYPSLAALISEARDLGEEMGVQARILAPVDLRALGTQKEHSWDRLRAGAAMLLAQPPTTDATETYRRHLKAIDDAGLRDRVLLNIFPFKDRADAESVEARFGWALGEEAKKEAAEGEKVVLGQARAVANKMKRDGLRGAYLAARGNPGLAREILR